MVERKGVKAAVKAAAQTTQPAEAKTEAKPAVSEKVEAEVEAAALIKAEAAPVEKEAKAAPAKKATARKAASRTAAKKATTPKETMEREAAPKAETKREAAPKAAKEETVKKTPTRKAAESKADAHFQFNGKDLVAKDVLDQAVKVLKRARRGVKIKAVGLCIVTNEGAAYYVVNSEGGDDHKIMLQSDMKD